ncbi:hypothetical protein BU17DRAFT_61978 [Hysterangium stoloniferum]|nr:hypothetical protein BU17DRAFT_61978 [Hysterangium stoloniferum]
MISLNKLPTVDLTIFQGGAPDTTISDAPLQKIPYYSEHITKNITFHYSFKIGGKDLGSSVTFGSGVHLDTLYQAAKARGKIFVGANVSAILQNSKLLLPTEASSPPPKLSIQIFSGPYGTHAPGQRKIRAIGHVGRAKVETVHPAITRRIVGVPKPESDTILQLLFRQISENPPVPLDSNRCNSGAP